MIEPAAVSHLRLLRHFVPGNDRRKLQLAMTAQTGNIVNRKTCYNPPSPLAGGS